MYKLIKIKPNEKIFKITIKADENDGDYRTETTELNEEGFLKVIPYLKDLSENHSGDYEFESWDSDDMLNVPYGCDISCHTLEELNIICIDENGIVYSVVI